MGGFDFARTAGILQGRETAQFAAQVFRTFAAEPGIDGLSSFGRGRPVDDRTGDARIGTHIARHVVFELVHLFEVQRVCRVEACFSYHEFQIELFVVFTEFRPSSSCITLAVDGKLDEAVIQEAHRVFYVTLAQADAVLPVGGVGIHAVGLKGIHPVTRIAVYGFQNEVDEQGVFHMGTHERPFAVFEQGVASFVEAHAAQVAFLELFAVFHEGNQMTHYLAVAFFLILVQVHLFADGNRLDHGADDDA